MTTEQIDHLQKPEGAEWVDAAFRHAYRPSNHSVAICGYDGPSTWQDSWEIPPNICPICIAILPEFLDLKERRWINP